jgi:DNA replication protein DnaC
MDRDNLITTLTGKINDETYNRIEASFPVSGICPTCDDVRSFLLDGTLYECDCQTQKLLQRHYYAANIPREYHDICLKDFIGVNREEVVSIVTDYLNNFDDNFHYGLGLTFSGSYGTGKTFAMCCVLKELVQQGRDVFFVTFDELIDTWGQSWHNEEAKRLLQDKLKKAEVLGLDELRTDKRNEFGFLADGLQTVIRHRTSNLLPTIITTNLEPQAEEKNFGKAFSLLSARNRRLVLAGKDHRGDEVRQINYDLARSHERRPIC